MTVKSDPVKPSTFNPPVFWISAILLLLLVLFASLMPQQA